MRICHLPQAGHEERFSTDHVIPNKHTRDDSTANLAFSCLRCNLFKGPNLSGIDPLTRQITILFNPRIQIWHEHFKWDTAVLVGLTPTGRTTIEVMQINAIDRIRLRQSLLAEGLPAGLNRFR